MSILRIMFPSSNFPSLTSKITFFIYISKQSFCADRLVFLSIYFMSNNLYTNDLASPIPNCVSSQLFFQPGLVFCYQNCSDLLWEKNVLKTVVFIAGKKNPATQNFFIRFSNENLIANIIFYALIWPKLNFGCYFTFEIIFKTLF